MQSGEFMAPGSLERALSGARTALAAALASGDDHDWHKLRIAVKEVRYQAESGVGGAPANPEQAELIEQCKPLQSMLGSWHDCVVQLQILDELESAAEHGPLREVIDHKRAQGLAGDSADGDRSPVVRGFRELCHQRAFGLVERFVMSQLMIEDGDCRHPTHPCALPRGR